MSEGTAIEKYERRVTSAERLFTRSPFSIVTMVARIKGHVTEEMLRNAVDKAQQRHTLLRVRIRDDNDHGQWFNSEAVQEIPVEIAPRQSENDWIKIHAEAAKIPYEFESRPAVRFVLVQSPDVSELIILCHHIICDGLSLAYLARDLMVYLGDPAREAEVLSDPAPIGLDNLPADVSQSRLRQIFINRMNRKWAEESVYFDNEDYQVLTKTYWDNYHHELFSVELSEEETSALVTRCKKEDVTITSALATAFSGAQSFVQGEQAHLERTVIATSLRDQLPNPPGEGMGFYAAGIELNLKYDRKKGFWDNARRYHKKIKPNFTNKKVFGQFVDWLYLEPTFLEAMNFKKLGALVPADSARYEKLSAFSRKEDTVLRFLKRDKMESPDMMFMGPAITNLGRMDFPKTYGALELDRLIMQPGGAFPLAHVNLVLGAVTCSGKLSLVVEYAPEAVDTQTMERIKDKAMAFLLKE
ncbi:MAG TPA: condensation domain-containing protein [Anaerolineae bacterium]|nr:condensation domain-containing protein [Anaerolineae bacterium]